MKNLENFWACAVWYNGLDLQIGVVKNYKSEDEFLRLTADAYSGCKWFTGKSQKAVWYKVRKYQQKRT